MLRVVVFANSGLVNVVSCDMFTIGDGLKNMCDAYLVY